MKKQLREALQNARASADTLPPEAQRQARPFVRSKPPAKGPQPAQMVAYDLETTNIAVGTPRPLYLTAYAPGVIHLAEPIRDMRHLQQLLLRHFLVDELKGTKFVAWAGNIFDAFIVAASLVELSDYVIRPYLTRNNSLRGFKVFEAGDETKKNAKGWEFLDGMAMLGFAALSLEKFLENFAPEFPKLKAAIDFSREGFDSTNPAHCEYAMRDSVGLWHGMNRAQEIMIENFNQPLAVTMGGICIRIFRRNIPEGVRIWAPDEELETVLREYVVRGGYCYCVRRYSGPVWKYDINQAYAAAMRETQLPAGRAVHEPNGLNKFAQVYIARITATHKTNDIPFYYRTEVGTKLCARFDTGQIYDTWLTSIEVNQLISEGWKIKVFESWAWENSFAMTDYVNGLEQLRTTCAGGPNGPIGTMTKATGNHSFGKTLESLDPIEFVLSQECPPGFMPYYPEGDADPMQHVFFRFLEIDEVEKKDYHQPQLGAFITAYVRMVVRRAALLRPGAWLYADTDCAVFSEDVTAELDIDSKRYGAWKIEESGAHYKIIAKKVYAQIGGDKPKRSAKGLNVRKLTPQDFDDWFDGTPPVQHQVQRNNFLKVMQGAEMFRAQVRHGTAVEKVT